MLGLKLLHSTYVSYVKGQYARSPSGNSKRKNDILKLIIYKKNNVQLFIQEQQLL